MWKWSEILKPIFCVIIQFRVFLILNILLFSFRYLFVAGEHCDHGTRIWAQNQFKVPVLNNWWQTETGHAITATCVGLGNSLSPPKNSGGKPVPGFDGMYIRG